jgi:hypothetical protein
MRRSLFGLAALLLPAAAEELAYEPFGYEAAAVLTGQAGGSGWSAAWYEDGAPVLTQAPGLGYMDARGLALVTAGGSADTSGESTMRSLRVLRESVSDSVWISFLWRLPVSNNKFEGVSLYRGGEQVFTVSNPSTTASSRLFLTGNATGSAVNTQRGDFGRTHFIVLRRSTTGATGDRVEIFIDPLLGDAPLAADAMIEGGNFDFDRVRIAAQDGATVFIDELRVGGSFAAVAPHHPAGAGDLDGDGLTDAEEAVLGLDPAVDHSALVAAIQARPGWFGLFRRSDILNADEGSVVIEAAPGSPVDFFLEIQSSDSLSSWQAFHLIRRQVVLPAGKNFLRVSLGSR